MCFVDTAGMRRKSRTERGTEYFSVLRALDALDRADIALLVIDATAGVTHQDQRLAERIGASGCPVVVVLNKWELVATEDRRWGPGRRRRPAGLPRRGAGAQGQRPVRPRACTTSSRPWPPPRRRTTRGSRPASSTGRSSRSRWPTRPSAPASSTRVQGAIDPPTFTLFTNGRLQPTYLRYVERGLRERFDLGPTPIKIRVRAKGRQRGWGSEAVRRSVGPVRPEGRPVPWCDRCDQQLEEEDLTEDGHCPDCGSEPLAHRTSPWWFKFLVVATVIYLGYRAFQGVTWVVHHV